MEGSLQNLYSMISPMGDPSLSVVPVLNRWVQEGNNIKKSHLHVLIKRLRSHKRYSQALEVSLWMTDKRYFQMSPGDAAIRLDLIAKVRGIEQAEKFFQNVPKQLKEEGGIYCALLNCYANAKSVQKAEALMEKMEALGLDRSTLVFNNLLTLYYRVGNYEKIDSLMHEMEEKGAACDNYTYYICLNAFAAQCDADKIDNIIQMAESNCNLTLQWNFYTTAANAYTKVGNFDKALGMLKKSEKLIEGESIGYDFLLTQYSTLGRKEEVLRLWEHYKKNRKVYNKSYMAILSSLLKFDDIESAEKLFDEWELQIPYTVKYDVRLPNMLLDAYSRKGLLENFDTLLQRIVVKEGKPDAKTWFHISKALLQRDDVEKAMKVMKEAILKPWWNPDEKIFVTSLIKLERQLGMDEVEKLIKLLIDYDIISSELQDKLLTSVGNGKRILETNAG